MFRSAFLCLVAAAMLQSCAGRGRECASAQASLQRSLDTMVAADADIRSAVVLVESPSCRIAAASGMADPEAQSPMQPDDQFFAASTSKMMTATLVMMLVEQGRIGLDDPVIKYLPDTLVQGLCTIDGVPHESEITIKRLLTHTSGVSDNWNSEFLAIVLENQDRFWPPQDVIAFTRAHCRAKFPPGQGWHYSDVGYLLLGLVIEKVTGKDLVNASRQMLFDPLGMRHTYWQFREDERPSIPGRGPSHCFRGDFDYTFMRSLSADWAGGGLRTTCGDLNRFMKAFVRNEIFKDKGTRDRMYEWVAVPKGESLYYGFGIIRDVIHDGDDPALPGGDEVIGHQGASGAFMFHFLRRGITISGTINQMQEEKIWPVMMEAVKALEAS